jgi:hypothetical protein
MSCSPRRIALFLVGLGSACSGIAQTHDVPVPDAPSAVVTEKKPSPRKSFDFKLLVNRSKVFPDLALNENRLTPMQKLKLSVNDSLSLAAVGGSLFSAGLGQARDNLPGYGQGAQGFGKRFGASMGTSASTQFFGTFLFATILEQDPRFFVRENLTLRQSLVYGLRRTLVTRTDQGQQTLNTSGLLGPLAAQGLANSYLPDEERTTARTMQRYGS